MPTQYSRGREFEYKVIKHLKKTWPLVIRSAGSKGLIDIVAVSQRQTILVSAKKSAYWSKEELSALLRLSKTLEHAIIFKAFLDRQGKLEFSSLG